jgi:hypothetical protein
MAIGQRIILGVLLLLVLARAQVQPVYACSGGTVLTINEVISESEIIVHAEVVMIDAVGQNGVLRIEQYLADNSGFNLEYLLLAQVQPSMYEAYRAGRWGSGGCATLLQELKVGEAAYFFLRRSEDGSFRPSLGPTQFSRGNLVYRFSEIQPTVHVVGQFDDRPEIVSEQVDEEGFVRLIEFLTGQLPNAALSDLSTFPLPAPVLIRTSKGEHFMLPVDHSPAVRIESLAGLHRRTVTGCEPVLNCEAFSPNGLELATVRAEGVELGWNGLVQGNSFQFSSTSEAIAVWNGDQIDVYTFYYPYYGIYTDSGTLAASVEIEASAETLPGRGIWSPDGRKLAYVDARGLWLWDVYAFNPAPQLLIAAQEDEDLLPIRFSEGGRYLSIHRNTASELIDVMTGTFLPDGVVSPNERWSLQFNSADALSPFNLCALAPYECQRGVSWVRDAQWLDSETYLYNECADNTFLECEVIGRHLHTGLSMGHYEGWLRDVEPTSGAILVQTSSTALTTAWGLVLTRDLADQIEGEVIYAEWLPSILLPEVE